MLEVNGDRAYRLLKRFAFERVGGTKGERRAAEIISAELINIGFKPIFEKFYVWTYMNTEAELEVLVPYQQKYKAAALGLTGETPPEGIESDLVYVETGGEGYLDGVKGKVAMMFGPLNANKYKALSDREVQAFIMISNPGRELTHTEISDYYFKRFGKIPGVFITYGDALEMIKNKASRVRIGVKQKEKRCKSRNIVVEIKGTEKEDEVIIVGGHYDSEPKTEGAHDNAAGSVVLVELARHFYSNPPRRTIRFVWFGSEEPGLKGSFAHVDRHKEEIDKVKMMINLDVGGGIIAENFAYITGNDYLKNYIEILSKEEGLDLRINTGVMSSDSSPFNDRGIPTISLGRSGGSTYYCHSAGDVAGFIDGNHLAMTGDFALLVLSRLANAKIFPFEKEIPEKIKEELDRYLREGLGMER